MDYIKRYQVLIIFAVLLMFMVGCSGEEKPNVLQEDHPVIVKLEGGDYGYSQPYTTYSRGPGRYKVNLVFDKLIEKDGKDFIPWLAEDWQVFDEGKRYIFDLRKDVNWHDGSPFTASDVLFTLEYLKEYPPVVPSGLFIDEDFVKEINVVDEYSIEIKLSEANVNFIEALTSIHIIPKHIWEGIERPDEFLSPEAVIGTGPYILTDYDKEHGTYRFQAYEGFWGPAQGVDVIEFVPVSDAVLALEKGDIHLSDIPVDVLSRFEKDAKFTVMENPGVWGYRLRFNMEKSPDFKSKELRQAFAYAIDRQDLVDKIARGAGITGSMGILPPHHRWYHPDLPPYTQDLMKAKELLGQANLNSANLEFELLVGEDLEVRMAELIREDLEDLGIKINIRSVDGKTRDSRIAEGNYQLVLVGHGGWARDPDYLRTRFSHSEGDWVDGLPGYENVELQELLERQITEIDEVIRINQMMQLQEMLAEDVPEIPLYFNTGHVVFNNEVYGGWMHTFDHHNVTHNKLSFLKRQ